MIGLTCIITNMSSWSDHILPPWSLQEVAHLASAAAAAGDADAVVVGGVDFAWKAIEADLGELRGFWAILGEDRWEKKDRTANRTFQGGV